MKTVVLTNENGDRLGESEIIEAHTNGGKLHQAFSIIVWNPEKTHMLIQKRADCKMLWPGYWSNTCCSHPQGKRSIEEEAATRLQEECGFTCPLTVHSSFTYKAEDPEGRGTEHEYDTILVGEVSQETILNPDPDEISEITWIDVKKLKSDMQNHSNLYTPWFHRIIEVL